jgi:hypothetical protein
MIVEKQTTIDSGKTLVVLHIEGLIKLGESAAYFIAACKKLWGQDLVACNGRSGSDPTTGISVAPFDRFSVEVV